MNYKKRGFFVRLFSILLLCSLALGGSLSVHTIQTKADSYESAWFPLGALNLTQLAYESYSHSNSNHIDCTGSTYAFAPFTGTIVNASDNYGVMLFQSNDMVQFADGSIDYMTVMFMHGTPLYSTGTTVSQGDDLYRLGGRGANGAPAYGVHLDIGVYRGQSSSFGSRYSQFGDTYAFDAFFINPDRTSVWNEGVVESGNTVYNGAPSDYSGLWRELGTSETPDTPESSDVSVTYQVYDCASGRFLPNVTDLQDYAGIYGHSISAVYADLSSGNITYCVHVKGGGWLPEVTNRSDYAGIKSRPIDGLMMTTDTGRTIHYKVHLKSSNSWLPYVIGYDTDDSNNGYAGIFGEEIDGIQMYID